MVMVKRERLATFEVQPESKVSVDRISVLPEEVLGLILSFLTPREATTTSILGRSWKYLWTLTPNLNLDGSIEKKLENFVGDHNRAVVLVKERCNYIRWVNRVIAIPHMSNLEEFRVCFDLDANHTESIDEWLSYALRRETQRLELNLIDSTDSRPNKDHDLCYRFPYKKGNLPNNFKLLKQLSMHLVNVSGEAVEFFLRNCPLLERVSVSQSQVMSSLKIRRPCSSFKCLEISCCHNLKFVVVRDSNVVNIKYNGGRIYFDLINVPLLTQLWIGGSVTRGMTNVIKMFSSVLPQLEMFNIMFSLDVLSFQGFKAFPSIVELSNLKQMVVNISQCRSDMDYLLPVIFLIRASPCLQRFVLEAPFQLSAHKNLLGDEHAIMESFKINLKAYSHLKDVEFVGYNGGIRQYGLIMHFVNNNVALENLVIDTRCFEPRSHRPWECIYQQKMDNEIFARAYAKEQLEEHVPSRINLKIL